MKIPTKFTPIPWTKKLRLLFSPLYIYVKDGKRIEYKLGRKGVLHIYSITRHIPHPYHENFS